MDWPDEIVETAAKAQWAEASEAMDLPDWDSIREDQRASVLTSVRVCLDAIAPYVVYRERHIPGYWSANVAHTIERIDPYLKCAECNEPVTDDYLCERCRNVDEC